VLSFPTGGAQNYIAHSTFNSFVHNGIVGLLEIEWAILGAQSGEKSGGQGFAAT